LPWMIPRLYRQIKLLHLSTPVYLTTWDFVIKSVFFELKVEISFCWSEGSTQ
jgi:hypothetical protein